MSTVKELVFEALDNANKNGYPPTELTVEQNVTELLDFDASLENCNVADIRASVAEWLDSQRNLDK